MSARNRLRSKQDNKRRIEQAQDQPASAPQRAASRLTGLDAPANINPHVVQLAHLGGASPAQAARAAKQMQRRRGNASMAQLVAQARQDTLRVQAKLVVTQPGDRYEQEADRAAAQAQLTAAQPNSVQRAALSSVGPGAGVPVASAVEAGIQSARTGGQPLPEHVRSQMEGALGADFAGVRLHIGPKAHGLNESLQARAFTTGRDIFFRQGEYQPGSPGGRELLAHELAHVVQQSITNLVSSDNGPKLVQRYPEKLQKETNIYKREKNDAKHHGVLLAGTIIEVDIDDFFDDMFRYYRITVGDTKGSENIYVTGDDLLDLNSNLIKRDVNATKPSVWNTGLIVKDYVASNGINLRRGTFVEIIPKDREYYRVKIVKIPMDKGSNDQAIFADVPVNIVQEEPEYRNIEEFSSSLNRNPEKTEDYEYAEVKGELFIGQPKPSDVRQGRLGNCYYLSTLISLVSRDAGKKQIMSMIKPVENSEGSRYIVHFPPKRNETLGVSAEVSTWFVVKVHQNKKRVLAFASVYKELRQDQPYLVDADKTPLWPLIMEKALVYHPSARNNILAQPGFRTIEGSMAISAFSVLGYKHNQINIDSRSDVREIFNSVKSALHTNKPVIVGTPTVHREYQERGPGLSVNHAYAVIDVNEKEIVLINPLEDESSPDRTIKMTLTYFRDRFSALILPD